MSGEQHLADARRRAEEALAEYDRLWGAAHATNAYGRAVVGLASALRALLAAGPEAPPPPSDAVREAAEVVRTILTAHDARLSESGVLTYGPPSKGTGFVAAIQWLRRYDAARGGE